MKGLVQFVFILLVSAATRVAAQNGKPIIIPTDSTTLIKNPAFTKDTGIVVVKNDTVKTVSKHDPRKATLRSLIIPGWGQAYNHEYWKIPLVYGAIGAAAGFYIYNNTWYKRAKYAFEIKVNGDTQRYSTIHPLLQPLPAQSLQLYRNSFRRDRDYATLYFILAWGLNIADATVFAHLRDFDVSEDLSLKLVPVIRASGNAGFSLVLALKQPFKERRTLF